MNNQKTFGILSSSVNPTQLSATVSGAILSISALIIYGAANFFHVVIGSDAISAFATQAGLAVGSLYFIFGVIRKVIVTIQQKFSAPK